MNKYNEIATGVLTNVGGKDNVSNLYHCMTRLRFVLKDKTAAAEDAIKAVKGVLGINWDKSGELQVIIGPDVDNVYKQLLDLTGLKETEKIDENLDEVKDHSLKGILNEIVGAFSACMNPLVPMFVLVGTFNVIAALIGPSFFKLVAEDSALYTNFYNVGQAIIYFLPVLIAVPAARHFRTNQYISLVLACLLVYPSFIELISSGTYTVFGIPATSATYTSSVLPIMLTVFVQKYVEKLADRISPTSMKVILFPFLTVLIMLPLMFCVLGPLGTLIGTLLANAIIGLRTAAGPIETALVTALIPFMTAFGIGRPIFFICMSMLFANGVEYAYMPIAMVLNNFLAMAVALGFALKNKGNDRQLGITSFVACLLGGVSEPTLFGILLPHKKLYLPVIIGGAIGGLVLGILNVGYYQFGPSNVLSVIGYISAADASNFTKGCIAAGVTFLATLLMVLFTYRKEEKQQ